MSASQRLSTSATTTADGTILALVGSLDIATADQFETAVAEQVRPDGVIVLDAAGLLICDSTGLGAIVRAHRRAVATGSHLVVRSPRPYIADLLAMTGVDKVIEVRR